MPSACLWNHKKNVNILWGVQLGKNICCLMINLDIKIISSGSINYHISVFDYCRGLYSFILSFSKFNLQYISMTICIDSEHNRLITSIRDFRKYGIYECWSWNPALVKSSSELPFSFWKENIGTHNIVLE